MARLNLHNIHQKSNGQTLFLYSEKQNKLQTIIGQKFRRGQKFRLTPDLKEMRRILPETTADLCAPLLVLFPEGMDSMHKNVEKRIEI